MMLTLALLGFFAQAAGAQEPADQTYDLSKARWKPIVGYQGKISEDVTEMGKVLILSGEKILRERRLFDTYSFSATMDIPGADDEGRGTIRLAFSRASGRKGGENLKYGFHEKVVMVKGTEEGEWRYTFENGNALEKDDLSVVRTLLMTPRSRKRGEPVEENLYHTPKPVKVGESWAPPVKPFAKAVMGDDGLGDVELDKAKAQMTLKSVSTRNGILYGRLVATYDLPILRFAGLKLDKSILLRSTAELEASIDGKLPDVVGDLKLEIRGKTTSLPPGSPHSVNLDVDWSRTSSIFWQTVR